jgi:hypothetical protein
MRETGFDLLIFLLSPLLQKPPLRDTFQSVLSVWMTLQVLQNGSSNFCFLLGSIFHSSNLSCPLYFCKDRGPLSTPDARTKIQFLIVFFRTTPEVSKRKWDICFPGNYTLAPF